MIPANLTVNAFCAVLFLVVCYVIRIIFFYKMTWPAKSWNRANDQIDLQLGENSLMKTFFA